MTIIRFVVALAATSALLAPSSAAAQAPLDGLIFTSNRCIGEPDCTGGYQVYRVQRDGSVRRLTSDDCGTRQAAWAPDGRSIVFAKNLRNSIGRSCAIGNLFTMAPDGTAQRPLTRGDFIDDAPDVSPDG